MKHPLQLALALAASTLASLGHGADTWNFAPPKDTFAKKAHLDLRELNDTIAGSKGFVRLSSDGSGFVDGAGKPIRFWSLNTGAYRQHPKRPKINLDRHARFVAKRGVNMVRFHGNITTKSGKASDINEAERDNLWRLVASMKKAGVYVTYSPYWANSSRIKPGTRGIMKSKSNHALLFIDENLKTAYKSWFKQVLTEKNPHTGKALKDDPALAVIQLQNEDSLLFWTISGINAEGKTELQRRFGEFAKTKYGSVAKAMTAWNNTKIPGDNPASGQLGFYNIWEMTKDGNVHKGNNKGAKARIADQLECSAKIMYDFNTEMANYLRKELGCKQLINAGNWKTADNVLLNDAERWSYTANEIIGVNRYYSPVHKGKHRGWAIINGDTYADESVLVNPRKFPLTLRQVANKPMCMYESSWVQPLGYESEAPLLISAYSSLTGFDSYFWFATGVEDWYQPASANGYLPSHGKWVCATPMTMGQWPAAALAFRKGYIKEGKPAVSEHRGLDDIWERKTPIIAEDAGYDPNRDKGDIVALSSVKTAVDQMAYLVGPVTVTYDSTASKSKVDSALNKHIDHDKKTVTSNTKELTWDHGNGIVTLNAPKAQGITGFIKGKTFKLNDLSVTSDNPYVTVMAVPLDDKPLKTSSKILVQVGTKARPTGWRTTKQGDLFKIQSYGKAPWQIDKASLSVSFNNKRLKTAIVCDENFMEKGKVALKNGTLSFPEDVMYVVVTTK